MNQQQDQQVSLQSLQQYYEYVRYEMMRISEYLKNSQNICDGVENVIITALSAQDSQQRNNAGITLEIMRESNLIPHTQDVLNLVISSSNTNSLLYLVTYTSSLVKSFKRLKVFNEDQVLLNILAQFLLCLHNPNLNQQQVKILVKSIPHLMDLSCSTNQPDWFLLTTLMEVERLFDNSNSKRDIYIGLNIIYELIMDIFANEKVNDVLINLLQKMFQILESITNIVYAEIVSANKDIQNLEGSLQILEMTCHILTISIQRIQNRKSDLMQVFLNNIYLMNFYENILSYNFNKALQLQNCDPQISLITYDLNNQNGFTLNSLFKVINGIKYHTLKSLVVMNSYYLQKEYQQKQQTFDSSQVMQNYACFLQKYEQILLYVCQQVHLCVKNCQSDEYSTYITVNKKIFYYFEFEIYCYSQDRIFVQEKNKDNYQIKKQVQSSCIQNIDFAVIFIINSVNDSKFYKFFSQNYQEQNINIESIFFNKQKIIIHNNLQQNQNVLKQNIIKNIIISIFNEVLLTIAYTNAQDMDKYGEESEEFIRFEQDLYNNRESDVLKSNGCELLYKLGQSIDGFLAYVINYCCKVIEYTYNQSKFKDQAFFDNMKKYQHSLFTSLSNSNKIETVLLVLIILSPQAGQRRDLLKQIENTLSQYFSNIIKESGIARIRCSGLIRHYSIYLFTEYDRQAKVHVAINTKLLSDMMIFLIRSLKNQEEPKGSNIATDTLWRLVRSEELKGCIESIIVDIIETLIQFITESKNECFFDFLQNIIGSHSYVIKNYATNIIKNLCERIIKEFNDIKGKKYISSLIIMRCISCIIEFTNQERIMNDFYIYFEENIVQIMKYLDIVEQIQFEDKLCDLGVSVLQHLREHEEIVDVIGRNLDRMFEKNSKSLIGESFYELLLEILKSSYLIYDKQYILCNVFRIGIETIRQLNLSKLTYQYTEFIQSCFLIQIGIQYNNEVFLTKQKLYEDIVIYLIDLYHILTQQEFYPLKYIQIFLLFFYYQPVQTINAFKNANLIVHLIQNLETVYIQKHLEYAYDRKILAYGLISLIDNWQQCQLNHSDVITLFKLALYALDYQGNNTNQVEQSNIIQEYKHKGSFEKSAKISRPQFNDDDTWLQSNEDPDDLYDINVSDLEYERLANFYYKPERDFYPNIERYNPPVYRSDEYSMYRQLLKKLKKDQGELLKLMLNSLNEQETKLYNSIMKAQIIQTSNNQFAVRQIKKIKKKNLFCQQDDMIEDNNLPKLNENTSSSSGFQNDRIIDESI